MKQRRIEIQERLKEISSAIDSLNKERVNLIYEDLLISDETQWFTEQKETHGRGKKKFTSLIGRINWKEDFKDDDTGHVITIERSQVVRENGSWIV